MSTCKNCGVTGPARQPLCFPNLVGDNTRHDFVQAGAGAGAGAPVPVSRREYGRPRMQRIVHYFLRGAHLRAPAARIVSTYGLAGYVKRSTEKCVELCFIGMRAFDALDELNDKVPAYRIAEYEAGGYLSEDPVVMNERHGLWSFAGKFTYFTLPSGLVSSADVSADEEIQYAGVSFKSMSIGGSPGKERLSYWRWRGRVFRGASCFSAHPLP